VEVIGTDIGKEKGLAIVMCKSSPAADSRGLLCLRPYRGGKTWEASHLSGDFLELN